MLDEVSLFSWVQSNWDSSFDMYASNLYLHVSYVSNIRMSHLYLCVWYGSHQIMTYSTEIATPLESTKSRNSNSSVQIQIQSKSQFEFVQQNTEKSESVDIVDFGGVAMLGETVRCIYGKIQWNMVSTYQMTYHKCRNLVRISLPNHTTNKLDPLGRPLQQGGEDASDALSL